jgi:hypothetical protein
MKGNLISHKIGGGGDFLAEREQGTEVSMG